MLVLLQKDTRRSRGAGEEIQFGYYSTEDVRRVAEGHGGEID
jgi:hypothetical protein